MNYDDFLKLLHKAGLTKEEFKMLSDTPTGTFNGWSISSRKKTPLWVKSWLELYIENKDLKTAIRINKKYGK